MQTTLRYDRSLVVALVPEFGTRAARLGHTAHGTALWESRCERESGAL